MIIATSFSAYFIFMLVLRVTVIQFYSEGVLSCSGDISLNAVYQLQRLNKYASVITAFRDEL